MSCDTLHQGDTVRFGFLIGQVTLVEHSLSCHMIVVGFTQFASDDLFVPVNIPGEFDDLEPPASGRGRISQLVLIELPSAASEGQL